MASLDDFLKEWNNGEPFIKASTSGSTDIPKQISLLKKDMRVSARATNAFFGINSRSVMAIPLSMDYIAGKMMAVRALEARCRLIEMPVSNEVSIKEHIDLLSVVPTQLFYLLQNSDSLRLIRNLLIGGGPIPALLEERIAMADIEAWHSYGMTETCSHVALRKVGHDSNYRAMSGISFEQDVRGCLIIHSENFSWERLVTNDVVELIDAKTFRWLGRADNVVNSGGLKLHPEIIEEDYRQKIKDLPPFYLTGEIDEVLGQRLVMVAEKPDSEILDELKKAFDDHKILPKRIVWVDKLPATANGKPKRVAPNLL